MRKSHIALLILTMTACCWLWPTLTGVAATTRFAVIGDFGDVIRGEGLPLSQVQTVANMVKAWNVDCVVTVGDNYYEYNAPAPPSMPDAVTSAYYLDRDVGQYYRQFMGAYQGVLGAGASSNHLFFTPGNHDWGNRTNQPHSLDGYLNFLTLPGAGVAVGGVLSGNHRYYDFIQGCVHFFVLSSDDSESQTSFGGITSTSPQANWLMAALADSKNNHPEEAWRVVLLHHPPFSSAYGSQRSTLRWPFRQWGADVIFQGHAHHYERLGFDGLYYITEGIGGEDVGTGFTPGSSQSLVQSQADFGAMLVEANETAMTFSQYHAGFATAASVAFDTFTLVKNSVDGILERLVDGAASDDAEETLSPSAYTDNDSVLDLEDGVASTDKRTIGLRFQNITIPQGAVITRAYLQFKAATNNSGSGTVMTIKGQKTLPANTFSPASGPAARFDSAATTQSTTWSIGTWSAEQAAANQRTPELTAVIKEITDQVSWNSGNPLAVLLRRTTTGTSTPKRQAYAYESTKLDNNNIGRRAGPAILHVEWLNPQPPPLVSVPLVSVGARDSDASESDAADTASFTICRTGPTTSLLMVNYGLTGSASAGDYTVVAPATTTSATIPAGFTSVVVTIQATSDATVENPETVILTLNDVQNSYNRGVTYSATIAIHDIRPPNVAATSGDGQVTLAWNAVPGATAYNIRRSTTSGSFPPSPTSTTTGTSIVDGSLANGTAYYYVITALKNSSESVYSRQVEVTPLPPPQGLTVTTGNPGQQILSWTAVTGAEWYHLMRGSVSGMYTTNFRSTGNSYIDSSSAAGYYYVVSAVKGCSEGPFSSPATRAGADHPVVVRTSPWVLSYVYGSPGPLTYVDPELIVDDPDPTTINSATVSIVSGFNSSLDTLEYTAPSGNPITAPPPANGVLTLTGPAGATLADYQAALRAVRYRVTSNNNNGSATRVIKFVVTANAAAGDPGYRQINIKSGNTPPTFTSVSTMSGGLEDSDYAITYAALRAAGNEADGTADTLAYQFRTLTSGTLKETNGQAVAANGLLGPGERWIWRVAANANGTIGAFTIRAFDGVAASSSDVAVNVAVTAVNDPPTVNLAIPSVSCNEDAGPQSVPNVATGNPGPADEAGQTINFIVNNNDNAALFSVPPAIAANGTLTYTPAPQMNGVAHVSVWAHDNGGIANGGLDTSVTAQTITITVTAVNDPPTILCPGPITININDLSTPVLINGISPGPANESGQTVSIAASSSNPSLFSQLAVSYNNPDTVATLSITPAFNARGLATVTLTVTDTGGTANGGSDTTICNFTVNVVPPTVTITASDPVVVEVVGAAGTTDGQFTVTRSGGLAADLMVRVQVSGTVTVPNDYYPIPDNMFIPAGSLSGTIPVYPFADYVYEPTETLNIQILSDPAYSTAVPNSATVIFYSWANLLPLSGDTISACTSINEVPRVVGKSITSGGNTRAAAWDIPENQPWQNLSGALLVVPLALVNNIEASGINATRTVGWGSKTTGERVAFASDGTQAGAIELPSLGGPNSKAVAIDGGTLVVGQAETADPYQHACYWDLSGPSPVVVDIGQYYDDWSGDPTASSIANSINIGPHAVGETTSFGITIPTICLSLVDFGDLLPIPGTDDNGSAQSINDNNVIVGYSWTSGFGKKAVRWDFDGFWFTPSFLPLPTSAPADAESFALKVNNDNVIVGYAIHSTFPEGKAIVWISGVAYFLGDLAPAANVSYLRANSINNRGEIVGEMLNNGLWQGFILRR